MTDHDPPETCPNCGEAYDEAVHPDTDPYDRDEDGAVTGLNDAIPSDYDRACSIGSLHPEWGNWTFYHA